MSPDSRKAGSSVPSSDTSPVGGASALGSAGGGNLERRIAEVGRDLGRGLAAVLAELPGAPGRPHQLVALLGINRAVAGRLLQAAAARDPFETLHVAPGPDPLRRLVATAGRKGAAADTVAAAAQAIEEFDLLIRREAGTRPALDAMISANLPDARERFELASKYSIHKGISQLKGVLAETWLGVAVVVPSGSDPLRLDLTWLNGAVAMQRLRPGVTARFSYRNRVGDTPRPESATGAADSLESEGIETLDRFCTNPAAQLEARRAGDAIHYTLPDDLLGPNDVVDMFVVDHHPAAMRRYATEAPRHRISLFVEPAFPVANLVFDTLVHEDVFPGSDPELVVFDTGYDGIANVNDEARDIDRVDLSESVEPLGRDFSRFTLDAVPRYADMLAHLAGRHGWEPGRFRGWRVTMRYPVYGWQVCQSFQPEAR